MAGIVTLNCVQTSGTVNELMLPVMTWMSLSIVTWNVMLDVVLMICVMGLRVLYLVEAC